MSETKFDFSVRNVPDSWTAAADEAPQGTPGPIASKKTGRRLPTGTRPDLLTGALTGIAMTVITGAAWYSLSVAGIYTGPWLAVLMGSLIAIAVRLGAGPAGPEMRVGVGAALYIAGVLGVVFWVSREQFVALNRRKPSFGEVEEIVTALYLNDLTTILAWMIGLGAMGWLTFALRHRRR